MTPHFVGLTAGNRVAKVETNNRPYSLKLTGTGIILERNECVSHAWETRRFVACESARCRRRAHILLYICLFTFVYEDNLMMSRYACMRQQSKMHFNVKSSAGDELDKFLTDDDTSKTHNEFSKRTHSEDLCSFEERGILTKQKHNLQICNFKIKSCFCRWFLYACKRDEINNHILLFHYFEFSKLLCKPNVVVIYEIKIKDKLKFVYKYIL